MIEINLLPDELKKKESGLKGFDLGNLKLQNMPILNIGIGVIGLLVLAYFILFAAAAYSNNILKQLSKKNTGLLPLVRESETLKSRRDTMLKKVNTINELMVKRFSWARKLNALSDSMAPGVWLTDISYDESITERTVARPPAHPMIAIPKQKLPQLPLQQEVITEKVVVRYLVMSGCASSRGEEGAAVVGRFIKSLKENPDFYTDISDIALGSIKSDKIEDQEVMRFKITCAFKD